VSALLNQGNGTFAVQGAYGVGTEPVAALAADLNGDGKLDLAVGNDASNDVSVLLNKGNGTFATMGTYAVGANPLSIAAADLNGDGKPDIAVANLGSNDVSVLLNNGNGTFATMGTYVVGGQPRSLAARSRRATRRANFHDRACLKVRPCRSYMSRTPAPPRTRGNP